MQVYIVQEMVPSTMDTTLFLCGTVVEQVDACKSLGIIINSKPLWSDHAAGICNKARKILDLVYGGSIKTHLSVL